jgi:hypothetical protein
MPISMRFHIVRTLFYRKNNPEELDEFVDKSDIFMKIDTLIDSICLGQYTGQ